MNTADVVRFYRFLAMSDHPVAKVAREVRHRVQTFSVPVPKPVAVSMEYARLMSSHATSYAKRVLVAEPIFKSHCKSYGARLRTDSAIHYVRGRGDIVVGDDVMLDGCIGIHFAARYSDCPKLTIGDRTGIGHNSTLTIGKSITIGSDCRIASDVLIFDTSGHSSDPAARLAGQAAHPDEVKPVVIEDNVWIGIRAIIAPGVTIGEGAVVSAAAVVLADVPAYTVVAGNPARRIATLTPPSQKASDNKAPRDGAAVSGGSRV